MNLVTDIGNSACKAAVFRQGDMLAFWQWETGITHPLRQILEEYPEIETAIVSSVRRDDAGLRKAMEEAGIRVLVLDENTTLPLKNRYRTPSSLGKDRLAAAVGANARFPGQNLLVIDAGTAITMDFVSAANEYLGGNISPGLSMRFRSLHEYTDNLPLIEPIEEIPAGNAAAGEKPSFPGKDTEEAIRAGVINGIIFELDEYLNRLKNRYPDLQVIMTGGDSGFFDKKLKNSIFVDPVLNLNGLLRILEYNVED
jgi:type III pantothenate kinase